MGKNKENVKGTEQESLEMSEGQESTETGTETQLGDDLETSEDESAPAVILPKYSDKTYLESQEAEFPSDLTSKKFDAEREPKVQSGLKSIAELMPEKINPLVLLLGKWWENKAARSVIKDMIDAEATSKGIASDVYLQVELRKNVDTLSTIQQAVDRMKYAITYFKPRGGISTKEIYKVMTIDGKMFNVPMSILESAKLQFGDNKVELKAFVIAHSTAMEIEEIL